LKKDLIYKQWRTLEKMQSKHYHHKTPQLIKFFNASSCCLQLR